MAEPNVKCDVTISARVSATESAEKIVAAIGNFFPRMTVVEKSEERIVCRSSDASALREAIFGRRILDSVRSILRSNMQDGRTIIELNRQAAAAGKLSIDAGGGGGALGPIVVEIESQDMEGFIDWLTPRTQNGRPVVPLAVVESHVE